mgnify:FL=1
MTSILHSSITAPGDTESSFFPVPESMRDRSERRRMMAQDLISSAFTGVPRGFYRAYAMSSALQQSPTTLRDTFAEGQVSSAVQTQGEVRAIDRVATAQPEVSSMTQDQKTAVDGVTHVDQTGRQGQEYGRDEHGLSYRNRKK